MGINIISMISTISNVIPEGMRKNAAKPNKIVKDLYDLDGTHPYKTKEIVPGKLWEIVYTHENIAITDTDIKKLGKDIFGMDAK